ncbi:MAG: YbjN domain-containing protein [Clostridia bacterium]|nr:YbjN domain-containing protein [Clostridia bacterium]
MGWFGKKTEKPEEYRVTPAEPVKPLRPEERTFTKQELLDIAAEALDAKNFHYNRNEEKEYIDFKITLSTCKKMGSVRVIIIPNNNNAIATYAVCPQNADESERAAVMEYITRANYGLRVGNFEMDLRDGEVRYKTYLQMQSDVPPLKTVDRYIALSYLMLEKYGNGLLSVMFGVTSPEEAVKAAEA